MGLDKTSGLIGKVKKHALGDYVICQLKSQALKFIQSLAMRTLWCGIRLFGNCFVYCVS